MKSQQTLILRDFLDYENALKSLSESFTAGEKTKIKESVNYLAEEPKQILARTGHKLVHWRPKSVMAILKVVIKEANKKPGWELELVAANLLEWLVLLEGYALLVDGVKEPSIWEQQLRKVVSAFLYYRDSPDAIRMRKARRQGGRMRALQKGTELAERNEKICKDYANFLDSGMSREAAGTLARKYDITTSQIRRIVKKAPKK